MVFLSDVVLDAATGEVARLRTIEPVEEDPRRDPVADADVSRAVLTPSSVVTALRPSRASISSLKMLWGPRRAARVAGLPRFEARGRRRPAVADRVIAGAAALALFRRHRKAIANSCLIVGGIIAIVAMVARRSGAPMICLIFRCSKNSARCFCELFPCSAVRKFARNHAEKAMTCQVRAGRKCRPSLFFACGQGNCAGSREAIHDVGRRHRQTYANP